MMDLEFLGEEDLGWFFYKKQDKKFYGQTMNFEFRIYNLKAASVLLSFHLKEMTPSVFFFNLALLIYYTLQI